MGIDATFFQANQALLMGAAALLCGAALLHLVMIRMIRRRGQAQDQTPKRR